MDILPILMELRMSKASSREASGNSSSSSSSTRSPSAALAVLTNPTLWRHITSCMAGWPHLALQFRQQVLSKASRGTSITGTPKHLLPLRSETLARLVDAAIAENDDRVLKMLYELLKSSPVQDQSCDGDDPKRAFSGAMAAALRFRRFEMLTWMRDVATSEHEWWHWDPDLMEHALCSHDLELVTWLYDHFPDSRGSSRNFYGGYPTLKWLDELVTRANSSGISPEMRQFLNQARTNHCTVQALDSAAKCGDVEIVKLVMEHCREDMCSVRAIETAAKFGHVDVLRMLHEGDARPWSSSMMDDTAARGHLEVVKFLHENRTEGCTTDAMDYAARFGYVEIVQFLHENRSEGCTSEAMRTAIANNHVEVVAFLFENRPELRTSEALEYLSREKRECVKAVHIQESPQSVSNGSERQIGSLLPGSVDQRCIKRARRELC